MIRLALDLELEQPFYINDTKDSAISYQKIIQIGYVIFDDQTGKYLEEVCRHVNYPFILSKFIQKLTGITSEDVNNAPELAEVMRELYALRKKYNASRKMLTWGGGDQPALAKETEEIPNFLEVENWPFGQSAFNVKHLYQFYCEQLGVGASGGLKKSANKLGVKFQGRAHNALTDAKVTAEVFMALQRRLTPSPIK